MSEKAKDIFLIVAKPLWEDEGVPDLGYEPIYEEIDHILRNPIPASTNDRIDPQLRRIVEVIIASIVPKFYRGSTERETDTVAQMVGSEFDEIMGRDY